MNADGFVLGYAHVPQNWSYASFDDFRIYSRPLSGVEIEALSLQSPSPRCDDGIRNQGEISVDVGGPCIDRLRTNLVTEYRFDGNSLDTSGSGNHAISNGSTIFVPGVSGQALSMSWGNAGISNSSVAPQLSTDATFSAWVKLPSLDYHAAQTVFAKNWDSTFAFMVATPSASMPTANVWLSLGTASIDTTTSGIDLREWTQISYTVASRGVMKLYINGQLIKTLGVTSVPSIFQRMNSNSLVF